MASVVAAIVLLGVNPLDAHLFAFTLLLADVTPLFVAYTAAGLAGSDPNKTAFSALNGSLRFIVPFIFICSGDIINKCI